MNLEIELSFSGLNHFEFFKRYDHYRSKNVRGLSFRIRPLFFVISF